MYDKFHIEQIVSERTYRRKLINRDGVYKMTCKPLFPAERVLKLGASSVDFKTRHVRMGHDVYNYMIRYVIQPVYRLYLASSRSSFPR